METETGSKVLEIAAFMRPELSDLFRHPTDLPE
jgi:hypothetical protein